MATIKPLSLQPFSSTSEEGEQWRLWKDDFNNYLIASDFDSKSDSKKIALFLLSCGRDLKRKYDELNIQPASGKTEVTLQQVFSALDAVFQSGKSEIFESSIFWSLTQEQSESFDNFYDRVKLQAVNCNFGNALSRNIRDKLVFGMKNHDLRERLLREKNLNENIVVEQSRICELSRIHADKMISVPSQHVEIINKKKTNFNKGANSAKKIECKNCGLRHEVKKCPAFGKTCHNCGKFNHWQSVCLTQKPQRGKGKYVNEMKTSDGENGNLNENEFQLGVITSEFEQINEIHKNFEWNEVLTLNNNYVSCKLDTGAHVNVVSNNLISQWSLMPNIFQSTIEIKSFGGHNIPIIGECFINCVTKKNVKRNLCFVVTSINSKTIIGLEACEQLQLIQRINEIVPNKSTAKIETPESILEEFNDVFEGRGNLKRPVKIVLRENAVPHVAAARKIPIALHDKVRNELDQMVLEGILAKVETPTDWVSSMLVIEKNGKLRIVLDPRPLNKEIKRSHYPIPNIDHLLSSLQGNQYFTVFDAKAAFWQQPLEEESSFLTTFSTPFGRYRWRVVPYGLNNAPEEFQRTMNDLFEEVRGVQPYIDDIAFGTQTIDEHCKLIRQILEIARREGLKLNRDKVQLAKNEIFYLGHNVSQQGLQADEKKIKAISEFPIPVNRDDLNRFLSMVRYLSKFLPNISNETHVLRQLLKSNISWVWDANTQVAFDNVKKLLTKAPTLTLFNSNDKVTLSVDASKYGLGATLLQNDRPVAYGSASLTDTQQRYSQIEKELLAIVYGLEHFNYYTYGRHLTVETDHRPLIGLKEKPYDSITPRLQRLLLRTNRYDFDLKFVPGKQLIMADTLSRAPLPTENFIFEDECVQKSVEVCLLVSATLSHWHELREQTKHDDALQDVIFHIRNGWPGLKSEVRSAAREYYHCHDELYESNGIVCRGQRFVVPKLEIQRILSILHVAHRGIVASKMKAREFLYWPGMDSSIEQYINRCETCQTHQKSNQREPLADRDLPNRPWQKIAADFFDLNGERYLLIIDYFSKFVEIQSMKSTTAKATINAFKVVYSRYGIPDEIVTDQGPPFNSSEMEDFHKSWGIAHNLTSPYNPRSNGLVERSVQTTKHLLKKSLEDGKDINLVLLDCRTTPSNDLPSPAELMMGRRLKTLLPMHPARLRPNFPIGKIKSHLINRQQKQKQHADLKSKGLSQLNKGSRVWFRLKMNKPYVSGIIEEVKSNRVYVIRAENGSSYIRNRFYIRPYKFNNIIKTTSVGENRDKYNETYFPTQMNQSGNVPNLPSSPISSTVTLPVTSPVISSDTSPVASPVASSPASPIASDIAEPSTFTRSGRAIIKPKRFNN